MLESLLGLLDHYQLMGSNDWIYWFDMELEIGQNWNRCFGWHGHIGKFIKDIPTILYITRIPFVLTRLTLFYVYKITQKEEFFDLYHFQTWIFHMVWTKISAQILYGDGWALNANVKTVRPESTEDMRWIVSVKIQQPQHTHRGGI